MQRTIKKELSFSLDTLERYRAKYGRSSSADTNGHSQPAESSTQQQSLVLSSPAAPATPPPSLFRPQSPPKVTKLQELQAKKEAYLRARAHEQELVQRTEKSTSTASSIAKAASPTPSAAPTSATKSSDSNGHTTAINSSCTEQASKSTGCYVNWASNHSTLASQPWCAISDLMYFCDKYEFKTLNTRDLRTHQEIVGEVRALLASKSPFDQRTRFPGNIHDPENLWVCIGRCASVEYHLQRIISAFRKPMNQLTPDKQRTIRQNFHLALSELRLDISARISEVRLYDRLVFEREFRLEWKDDA